MQSYNISTSVCASRYDSTHSRCCVLISECRGRMKVGKWINPPHCQSLLTPLSLFLFFLYSLCLILLLFILKVCFFLHAERSQSLCLLRRRMKKKKTKISQNGRNARSDELYSSSFILSLEEFKYRGDAYMCTLRLREKERVSK